MCRFLVSTDPNVLDFEKRLSLMKNGGPDNTSVTRIGDISMGHNRLAIVDLDDRSNQPMTIDTYTIVFNGEIYNHKELKLKYNLQCKTDSDTEVILRLYIKEGPRGLNNILGEFAFVIYDKQSDELVWYRDPLGIKPLYHKNLNYSTGNLELSSEIRSISDGKEISGNGIRDIFKYGFTDETDETMYQGIFNSVPGRLYRYNVSTKEYTSFEVQARPRGYPMSKTDEGMENQIYDSLEAAVKKRLMSDVPIACTLSGGIDSAIVAYFAQKHSKYRLKTYTIGFKGYDNEFEQARRVAKYLGTDHHEIEIDHDEILKNIDEIIDVMESPADKGSTIPTFFLARAMKDEKVVLVGEGADEIFGGYKRHQEFHPNMSKQQYLVDYMQIFSSEDDLYAARNLLTDIDPFNGVFIYDLEGELLSYHNMRIDKMFMHFGIEARPPFLDCDVVYFALNIPLHKKVNPSKKVLREAFKGKLPDWIIYQPKKPLKLPIDDLVEMQEVKDVVLSEVNIQGDDIPSIGLLKEIYEQPRDTRNRSRKLWITYLFKKWYAKNN